MRWGEQTRAAGGYSSVGAVVGAPTPRGGRNCVASCPECRSLVPGYGAQGAGADELRGFFDSKGLGAVVNSSRGILYAYRDHPGVSWQQAARSATEEMRSALWRVSGRE